MKLLCLLRKHKHCRVGKIHQFFTINQLNIQITESFKSLSPQFYGAACQVVSTKTFKPVKSAFYIAKLELRGGIVLFGCQKLVGGPGPFGSALKNCHILLFNCTNDGGLSTFQSGVRGLVIQFKC